MKLYGTLKAVLTSLITMPDLHLPSVESTFSFQMDLFRTQEGNPWEWWQVSEEYTHKDL